ncbi:MAG TPA: hypothetical protein PKW76_14050 [bacterium]|nr:hypothetical protein [bacterium]HPG46796.1 hypothetical protein [bacterium]HPM98874.1 hypothetical protein [bacterium]
MFKHLKAVFLLIALLSVVGYFANCTTSVEPSPMPGILTITLQSNPQDTLIVIIRDTLIVGPEDYFGAVIFQGRVFSDKNYAFLFNEKDNPRQEDKTYNIIERIDHEYTKYKIFESYVPPGSYDRIQFGIKGDLVKLSYFDIPVKMPEGESPTQTLEADFNVEENKRTEITVQISPFESVARYKDSYLFRPVLEITDVTYSN